jgi:hypothetical protein
MMRYQWVGVIVATLLLIPAAQAEERTNLKILYAGDKGGPRALDFAAFLEKHFTKVTVVALEAFTEREATKYDVVIFDWSSIYPRNQDGKIKFEGVETVRNITPPPVPKLSHNFDQPAIMIGPAGAYITDPLKLKPNWLCLCLHDFAHDIDETHEIFLKPTKISIPHEDIPTPNHYRGFPGGEKLGKTLKAWRMQTKEFPEIDPGWASDPYGFSDSPDAEAISAGLNDKLPKSVALSRHGNFFQWGFSAQPSDMTPSARQCFVNVVHYIKKFDRQRPLIHRLYKSREWVLGRFTYARYTQDEAWLPQLPDKLRERFGKDFDKYVAFCDEHLEFLHPSGKPILGSGKSLLVDEDVMGLGISNRKVELLDRCVALLEKGEQQELAIRVLKRYTTESFAEAEQWRQWLTKNRSRLFFTDVGGFKFLVKPVNY